MPINRWAKNAIYSTLPGILSGVLMQYFTIETNNDNLYHAIKIKKLLMDGLIDIDYVVNMIIAIYDCRDSEKMSIAYKEIIREEVQEFLEVFRMVLRKGCFPFRCNWAVFAWTIKTNAKPERYGRTD